MRYPRHPGRNAYEGSAFCSQRSRPDTLSFMGTELDATDWAIISEIQRDARLSFNQIAKRVNLSAPSVAARIRRLEEAGVIEGYHARISHPPPPPPPPPPRPPPPHPRPPP